MKVKGPRIWSVASVVAASCTVALLAQPQTVRAEARVTAAVDESDRVALEGNTHPLARAEFDRGAAPADLPAERMLLVLQHSPQQAAALAKLLAQQKNPGSRNYHHWLTPQEFGERFGVSPEDLAKVTDWLEANGFRVDRVADGRRVIEFSGTAGQVRTAFNAPIHKFVLNGKPHWANTRDPQIPRALSTVVAGVRSLHNFESKAHHQVAGVFRRNPDSGKVEAVTKAPQFTSPGGGFFAVGPADFATIYNVAPLWARPIPIDGTGQTIAIVQRTNINLSDVADFRALFGLPANPPTITLNGPDPGITADETEALIDVDWSGAVAKGATINMIVSASTNTTDGVDLSAEYAVDQNVAPIMSTSFGLCELFLGNAGNKFYSDLWQQAAAQGITSFVSTGDNGSGGCERPFELRGPVRIPGQRPGLDTLQRRRGWHRLPRQRPQPGCVLEPCERPDDEGLGSLLHPRDGVERLVRQRHLPRQLCHELQQPVPYQLVLRARPSLFLHERHRRKRWQEQLQPCGG